VVGAEYFIGGKKKKRLYCLPLVGRKQLGNGRGDWSESRPIHFVGRGGKGSVASSVVPNPWMMWGINMGGKEDGDTSFKFLEEKGRSHVRRAYQTFAARRNREGGSGCEKKNELADVANYLSPRGREREKKKKHRR